MREALLKVINDIKEFLISTNPEHTMEAVVAFLLEIDRKHSERVTKYISYRAEKAVQKKALKNRSSAKSKVNSSRFSSNPNSAM